MDSPLLDLPLLLKNGTIETHFQPITSIRRQSVLGLEALSRGVWNGQIFPPDQLFGEAARKNLSAELDARCREAALRHFVPLQKQNPAFMLFLNVHASLVEDEQGADEMARLVENAGLEPRQVVLEILETEFADAPQVQRTVRNLQARNFLIALDDIGAGHSNLDRIAFLKPDILKIDRKLVSQIHTDFHQREVFKSLVVLSEKIGGWIIAEGVECEAEALTILEVGGDLMQGYHLARPRKFALDEAPEIPNLVTTACAFKDRTLARVKQNRARHDERLAEMTRVLEPLRRAPLEEFSALLKNALANAPLAVSGCLLDENGVQITPTHLQNQRFETAKTIIFQPPGEGTDHSLKEYFFLLSEARLNPFFTLPYVPLPSGDLCVTASTFVRDKNGDNFVLVLHFRADQSELGA